MTMSSPSPKPSSSTRPFHHVSTRRPAYACAGADQRADVHALARLEWRVGEKARSIALAVGEQAAAVAPAALAGDRHVAKPPERRPQEADLAAGIGGQRPRRRRDIYAGTGQRG